MPIAFSTSETSNSYFWAPDKLAKKPLVRSLSQLAGRPYLTLDDFDLRSRAEANPEAVVERAPTLIIDCESAGY